MKKIKDYLIVGFYIVVMVCSLMGIIYSWQTAPTIEDLTIEERIRYEQMILFH